LLERRAKGVVQRFLRKVEVAQQANERGEDTPGFGAIDGVRHRAHALLRILACRRASTAADLAMPSMVSSSTTFGRLTI
jgi:hypothetical protein